MSAPEPSVPPLEWSEKTLKRLRNGAVAAGIRLQDLDDFMQDIIVHVLVNYDPAQASVDTYINRIIRWKAHDYYAARRKQHGVCPLDGNEHLLPTTPPAQEAAVDLNKVLLDPEAAQAILFSEGWACREIAEARQVSRETVRKEIIQFRRKNAAAYGMKGKQSERARKRSVGQLPPHGEGREADVSARE